MSGNRAKDIAPPPPSPENPNKTVIVYFGIFFDGTMNHRGQATIGEKYREKIVGLNKQEIKEVKKELGYTNSSVQQNDRSNVALLFPQFNEKSEDYVCRLYIEGIATEEDGSTSTIKGGAFGKGKTGIEAKVEKAIEKIPDEMNKQLKNLDKDANIALYFELFGFSRGAAAARNFVWNVLKKNKSITEKLKPRNLISIKNNYVGLFDTVSSHGLNLFSDDNVAELHLDAIKEAKYVFHICAADEFRENFALTDISSAKAKGKEIFIPGAHSDIGGGYPQGEYSVSLTASSNKTVDDVNTVVSIGSLKHLGWIRDLPTQNYTCLSGHTVQFKNNIKKGYSYIGLELMAENAKSYRTNMFSSIRQQHTTPAQLKEIKDMANDSTSLETCQQLFSNHYKRLDLRKDWLHFSSNDGSIGMGPREENGILRRNIINDKK